MFIQERGFMTMKELPDEIVDYMEANLHLNRKFVKCHIFFQTQRPSE